MNFSYENYYKVSNYGRVKRTREFTIYWKTGKGGKQKRHYEKEILNFYNLGGNYEGVFLAFKHKNGGSFLVHHLVLWAFVGECPEGKQACHRDDNPKNNYVDNLYWGTPKQNMEDSVKNGKHAKGETQGNSKLTEQDIIQIREWYEQGDQTQCQLATKFNVTQANISLILQNKSWKHV